MRTVKKLFSMISPDSRRRAVIALGLAGMALIFMSSFIRPQHDETETAAQPPPESSESDYRKTLEDELTYIISSIDGAGDVRIMITMDSTAEDIYAVDKNESESLSGESEQPETRRSAENEYVIVKGKDGSEQTVLKKQKMPEIRGVLIVCSGSTSAVVREKITLAAAGALGVPQSKVVVVN